MGEITYADLARLMREAIQRGEYPPGTALPRQDDLAALHRVHVNTVRLAVRELEAEGLVDSVRRRGTIVRPRRPLKRLGADRYAKSKWKFGLVAFAADREATGRPWQPGDQTATVRLVDADAAVAQALGLREDTSVYERSRLIKENGQPTHTLASYYRPEDVEGTPIVSTEVGPAGQGGGFMVLTLQGLEPHTITETLSSRMPTPEEVATLALPKGEPVMVLERTTATKDGKVVEFARGVHAASRFSWTYTFTIPD